MIQSTAGHPPQDILLKDTQPYFHLLRNIFLWEIRPLGILPCSTLL